MHELEYSLTLLDLAERSPCILFIVLVEIRSPIPRGLSIGPSLTFAHADTPVLDVRGDSAECHRLVVSAFAGASMRRRTGPRIKTQPSRMQLHVLAAHCADAGRTVDRRGRRACLLKGLPHEEIAPRRPPG